jgi:hypothetical protein
MRLERIKELLLEIDTICKEDGIGDIFSYSKVKEVLIAAQLGHVVCSEFSGADGIEPNGDGAEYKSTIGKRISGTYNGISVQSTWELQVEYLKRDKIGKYPNHYFARFDGSVIVELWKMSSDDVLNCLIPKLKRAYHSVSNKKDPRLGASVYMSEIKRFGTKLI